MADLNLKVSLAAFGLACLVVSGCSTAQDASQPRSDAGSSSEMQGPLPASAYAQVLDAVTRSAMTPSYDPSGTPADAGGAARCFVCEVISVDASRRTVMLDPVEFFLGEDASSEARKDGEDPNTVCYVRNVHQREDTLPLAAGAPILVRNGDGLSGLTVITGQEAERLLQRGEWGEGPLFLVGLGPEGVGFLCAMYIP